MKIVVLGGRGLIGANVVSKLQKLGHEVIAASQTTGVNTLTGEGLENALKGADVVIDVTNSPSFEDKAALEFFQASGRNIFDAEKKAGIKHHVALSVVGVQGMPNSGYFRAKVAQEKLIKESGIPYSILQATQFFEFVGQITESGAEGETIRIPSALFQPIASDEVAAAIAEIAIGSPLNKTIEIAGPEKIPMSELVQKYMNQKRDNRKLIADAKALYYGLQINDQSLTPSGKNPRLGSVRYEDWIKQPGNLK